MARQRDFSEHTAELIDDEIVSLVGGIEEKVSSLLSSHRSCLEALAGTLLENETLEKAEIQEIIAQSGEVPQGHRPGADAMHPRAHRGSARA